MCHFVLEGGVIARNRLDTMLAGSSSDAASSPKRSLDGIYSRVLRNALRDDFTAEEADLACGLLRTVIGSIVVLFSSFSAHSLGAMLDLTATEVQNILRDLHSIFDVPDDDLRPIRPQHASVRDYLLDKGRCTDPHFWIDEQQAHSQIAKYCLRLMNTSLHRDMCNLRMPDAGIRDVDADLLFQCLPPHLSYACLYWVPHVRQCHDHHEQKEQIYEFMQVHLLHWLEVLSLLAKLDDAMEMLGDLELLFVSRISTLFVMYRTWPLTMYVGARGGFSAGVDGGCQTLSSALPAGNGGNAAASVHLRHFVRAE
jgi:hypothetical protein